MKLYYEKTGSGDPIVFVHGNGEDHTIFRETVDILNKDYTCYAVDSRGHGKSPKVKEFHYDDMANDMVEFLNDHDLNNVTFFGFSDGAIIGILTALKTDRVGRLVLCGANLSPDGMKPWIRRVFKAAYLFSRNAKIKLMLTEPHITDEQLKSIQVPTLVLAGENDLVREKETEHIADVIPNADLLIIPEHNHESYVVHEPRAAAEFLVWTNQGGSHV